MSVFAFTLKPRYHLDDKGFAGDHEAVSNLNQERCYATIINNASPYARRARIVARETGWLPRIEEVVTVPLESAPDLVSVNPVSQIPALMDDEGNCWQDSTLICAWLDTQATGGARLIPTGDAQWPVRRLEALAVGLIEMNVRMVLEYRRPENERSPFWLRRWRGQSAPRL